jgi:hypothetical protein
MGVDVDNHGCAWVIGGQPAWNRPQIQLHQPIKSCLAGQFLLTQNYFKTGLTASMNERFAMPTMEMFPSFRSFSKARID